jgi:DNA-binding XRE family transcriptional regulator/desulfoferrodoxin (superoxide reductase-like protein)
MEVANMNQYVTGAVIKELREKKHLTQAELAERLCVSDKTISKWETAKGYPDISLLEPLAKSLDVSITELISGNAVNNVNVSANILRTKFYVCPVCGNVIHSVGEAVIHCHGILLSPCQAEETNEQHMIFIERVEDEYYVRIEHDMTKQHYISFVAALSSDKIQMIKLYPEGNAEARVKINGVKRILFYCNRDGLFSLKVVKGIDDRQNSYDDVEERRALEAEAKRLFG